MEILKQIPSASFDYDLPNHRIARYPLENRQDSKLLVLKNEQIVESHFYSIGDFLPENALLVFNDTKVIRARLLFHKDAGALIELFILEPIGTIVDLQLAFTQHSSATWKCMVGNSKRWKSGVLKMELRQGGDAITLTVNRIQKERDYEVITFSWDNPEVTFAEILELAGEMPLPPYLGRKAELSDLERYQTVFATLEGSVAAPTAGLHLTHDLISGLKDKNIAVERLTLHIGVGTFKPLTTPFIGEHAMHAERIIISKSTILHLLQHLDKPIIAVGTTSLRALESLFWIAHLVKKDTCLHPIILSQWFPYEAEQSENLTWEQSLRLILKYLHINKLDNLCASTSIMIVPGYHFKVINGLITNFHQPKSTLLLLVSALIGEKWKEVYQYALDHDFRFLSYGDSCFLLQEQANQ